MCFARFTDPEADLAPVSWLNSKSVLGSADPEPVAPTDSTKRTVNVKVQNYNQRKKEMKKEDTGRVAWDWGTVGNAVLVTWPERGPWRRQPAPSARRPGCSLSSSAGWSQTGPRGHRHRQTSAVLQRQSFLMMSF